MAKAPPLTKSRVQKLAANPGTRAALADKYLSPAQLKQRQMNTRLAQPVVPGSSMTQRDLSRQTKAAADVHYGPQENQLTQNLAAQQQVQRDTGDYYDAYLKELATHQQNVAGFQQQAQQAVAGLSQAGAGLGAGAAPEGMSAENQKNAANASAVRRALTDSFGAMLTSQGANANTFADTQTHVVGPGSKLQAVAGAQGKVGKVRQDITALAGEKGAYRDQLAATTKADESKNVLAQQALGLNVAKATSTAKTAAQRAAETARHNKASESNTAAARAQSAREKAAAGDHYGYTNAQWAAMGPAQRTNAAKKWKQQTATPGGKSTDPATKYAKDFYAKYGVKPAATAAVGNAKNSITTADSYVAELKKAGWTRPQIGPALLQGVTADKKAGQKGYPKQQALWLTVALDRAFLNGQISAGTAKRLHAAGYSVKLLGLNSTPAPVAGPTDLPSGGPTNPK